MNRKNCVTGIFWAVFFLFFLYLDGQMGEEASYWPGIICKIGLALSVASAVISGIRWKSEAGQSILPFSGEQVKRLLLAILLLILWVLSMSRIGFLAAAVIFMVLIAVSYDPIHEKKNAVRDIVVVVVFAAGMFALFTALGIVFPSGLLR